MKKIITITIFLNYIFSMTGIDLAILVDNRPVPEDIKSINTMTIIKYERSHQREKIRYFDCSIETKYTNSLPVFGFFSTQTSFPDNSK